MPGMMQQSSAHAFFVPIIYTQRQKRTRKLTNQSKFRTAGATVGGSQRLSVDFLKFSSKIQNLRPGNVPNLDPSKIYEIPCAGATRVRCASTLSINSTVLLNLVVVTIYDFLFLSLQNLLKNEIYHPLRIG
jgi:hypothetical protein